jgi:hypothetical protein
MFELRFHFPVFALRECATARDHEIELFSRSMDLSFLRPKRNWKIYETQLSFLICGHDNSRWIAYEFDDTNIDSEDIKEKIFPCEGMHRNPMAWHGQGDVFGLDANYPMWDPREFYLRIFLSRIAQASKEWDSVVKAVEDSIEAGIEVYSSHNWGKVPDSVGLTVPLET